MQLQHVYQPEAKPMQTKRLSLLMTCQNLYVMDCPKICHKTAVVPRLAKKGSLPHDSRRLHRKFFCCSWEANKDEVNLTPAEEGLEGDRRQIWDLYLCRQMETQVEAAWNETFLWKFSKIIQNNSLTDSEPFVKLISLPWALKLSLPISFI